jgi:hypothetical protein
MSLSSLKFNPVFAALNKIHLAKIYQESIFGVRDISSRYGVFSPLTKVIVMADKFKTAGKPTKTAPSETNPKKGPDHKGSQPKPKK